MNFNFNNWSLSLSLDGGRINELSYKGTKILGTYQRMDGKIGNTHICAPSFDKEGQEKYGLPFHGYARTLTWSIKKQTTNLVQITTNTVSTPSYPATLELTQEFELDTSFVHRVSVRHISGDDIPVNIGIHYYWDTPSGWNEIKIQNQNKKKAIETNGYMNLEENNMITFPHASYEMKSKGLRSAALWTSFKTDEKGNKQFNQDFCCIEPIIKWPGYFGSKSSILHAGESVSASIGLKKVV